MSAIAAGSAHRVLQLPVNEIAPHPFNAAERSQPQPDDPKWEELLASVRANGVRLPLLAVGREAFVAARPEAGSSIDPGYRYVLIYGHRRRVAALEADRQSVPVVVDDAILADDGDLDAMATENLGRQDLPDLAEAELFARYSDIGLSQRAIAERLGVNQATVSRRLALLLLAPRYARRWRPGVSPAPKRPSCPACCPTVPRVAGRRARTPTKAAIVAEPSRSRPNGSSCSTTGRHREPRNASSPNGNHAPKRMASESFWSMIPVLSWVSTTSTIASAVASTGRAPTWWERSIPARDTSISMCARWQSPISLRRRPTTTVTVTMAASDPSTAIHPRSRRRRVRIRLEPPVIQLPGGQQRPPGRAGCCRPRGGAAQRRRRGRRGGSGTSPPSLLHAHRTCTYQRRATQNPRTAVLVRGGGAVPDLSGAGTATRLGLPRRGQLGQGSIHDGMASCGGR